MEENQIGKTFFWVGLDEDEKPLKTRSFTPPLNKHRNRKPNLKHTLERNHVSFLIFNKEDEREEMKKPRMSEEALLTTRQKESSICESEDSFISFDSSYRDNGSDSTDSESGSDADEALQQPRQKILSECESEDSFVVFDGQTESESDCEDSLTVNEDKATSKSRQKVPSTCDSDDSFVVFDGPGNSESDNEVSFEERMLVKASLKPREKIPSICESEDSFVVFEGADDVESSDCEESDDDDQHSSDEDGDSGTKAACDEIDAVLPHRNLRKVTFAPAKELVSVHQMVHWSFAHQAARKGHWEMYARDRARFQERVNRIEMSIQSIFTGDHRNKVFNQRFKSDLN